LSVWILVKRRSTPHWRWWNRTLLTGQNRTAAQTHYAVRHLQRFPIGTPYAEIIAAVRELFAVRELNRAWLTIDQTGIGRPVVDLLRRAKITGQLRAVILTTGHTMSCGDGGAWLIPKQELVTTLQVLLQARRLKIAPTLPAADALVQELTKFRMKVSAANSETTEAWREGPQDDLVLAVAIAAWEGERCGALRPCRPFVLYQPGTH
jgi:hypothetical protein